MAFRARFRVGSSCGFGPLVSALALGLGTPGCTNDGDASLHAPESLAVGAYAPLAIGDGCSGGKLDLCSAEHVTGIAGVTVDDPRVLEVLPLESLPPELAAFGWPEGQRLVRGLTGGTTRLCLTAHFDDGSERKGCATVTVGVPDDLVVLPICGSSTHEGDGEPTFVTPGASVRFGVELHAKGKPLGGTLVDPLENTEPTRTGLMNYSWQSPAAGGSLELRSAHAPGAVERLETYEPGAVDELRAEVLLSGPHALYPGETLEASVDGAIGGVAVCDAFRTTASSETPEVCLGPAGERIWTAAASGVVLSAVASGTCQLSLGVAGGSGAVGTLSTSIVVLDPADKAREANVNEVCTALGARSCSHGRYYVLVCQKEGEKNYWKLGTLCEDLVCTYTKPEAECPAAGCVECR